jgi:hypothetical protein
MNTLSQELDRYMTIRRSLGYRLPRNGNWQRVVSRAVMFEPNKQREERLSGGSNWNSSS